MTNKEKKDLKYTLIAIVPIILIALFAFIVGCASVHLKWGDVEYTSYGDHALKEVHVTRTLLDGTKITVTVGSSDSKEVQANLAMYSVLSEALKRIPVTRDKENADDK